MAILGPKPEGQVQDMRVRRPSGGCADLHQRTEADFSGQSPRTPFGDRRWTDYGV